MKPEQQVRCETTGRRMIWGSEHWSYPHPHPHPHPHWLIERDGKREFTRSEKRYWVLEVKFQKPYFITRRIGLIRYLTCHFGFCTSRTTEELRHIGFLRTTKFIRYIRNPIYTTELLLFCTTGTGIFIRYIHSSDITGYDISEFNCSERKSLNTNKPSNSDDKLHIAKLQLVNTFWCHRCRKWQTCAGDEWVGRWVMWLATGDDVINQWQTSATGENNLVPILHGSSLHERRRCQ